MRGTPGLCSMLLALTAVGCGDDVMSYLSDVSEEPAGANCPAGGVRVDSGLDLDGNFQLDPDEIEDTEFVCVAAPAATPASLTNVVAEPAGENCTHGGAKIESGLDTSSDGTLDPGEVTSTEYVCGGGEALIVSAFNNDNNGVPLNQDDDVTLISAEIDLPAPGSVLVLGSADLYCTAVECPSGANLTLWLHETEADGNPPSQRGFVFLPSGQTEAVTRSSHFEVSEAGPKTFYFRGQDTNAGDATVYRPAITLVYIP